MLTVCLTRGRAQRIHVQGTCTSGVGAGTCPLPQIPKLIKLHFTIDFGTTSTTFGTKVCSLQPPASIGGKDQVTMDGDVYQREVVTSSGRHVSLVYTCACLGSEFADRCNCIRSAPYLDDTF